MQGIHSHAKPGPLPGLGFSGRGRYQTRGGRSLQVSASTGTTMPTFACPEMQLLSAAAHGVSQIASILPPKGNKAFSRIWPHGSVCTHGFPLRSANGDLVLQEYHARAAAAANGSSSAVFSFDVNGRSTLLPIPAALQTRLIRQVPPGVSLGCQAFVCV